MREVARSEASTSSRGSNPVPRILSLANSRGDASPIRIRGPEDERSEIPVVRIRSANAIIDIRSGNSSQNGSRSLEAVSGG
ncbi:hypothetical protein HALLA_15375 [Halostagnicola larsenii XH-48]|uniref:Uncharacterized protein n=1 Tax=Halostagnicola larsenii XH-48 TaxID=797299 RepID=W0JVI5_9EURY|nr:hypothetical protein HALLA_15375 [Halostagnicola larsenii XH-48]